MHRRLPLVSPRPPDDDLDTVASDITGALDQLVDALVYLVPQVERWPAPSYCLRAALQADEQWIRTRRRIKEVADRIREVAPTAAEDIDDLEAVIRNGLEASAEIGFGIGIRVGIGQRHRAEA